MKSRREFIEVLRDHNKLPHFARSDFLKELNELADASFAKGTVEGYLAALLIYHQLCEEFLRVLVKTSHFYVQCALFPQQIEDKKIKKKMTFGELLWEYEKTVQLDESAEFIKKCKQLNQIRVNMVHKITLKSSVASISKQTQRCKQLFEQIWELFDSIYDNLCGVLGDYRKNIEDFEEIANELEPLPEQSRTTRSS